MASPDDTMNGSISPITRRRFLATGAASVIAAAGLSAAPSAASAAHAAVGGTGAGELLSNGIRLPAVWPPHRDDLSPEPETPPYLVSPPAVIPIDTGRQLFVDDFLIERTSLTRTNHAAEYHPASPVLRPDRPWEGAGPNGAGGTAMVYSDGVWYDPAERIFKMWYAGDNCTCYATSTDGIHWQKPALDVKAGTNIVLSEHRDSTTVWADWEDADPARRYKLFRSYAIGDHWGLYIYFSPDGVHWGAPVRDSGSCGDRSTVFWNPFRKVWVFSLRHGWGRPRARRYWEMQDLLHSPMWTAIDQPTYWVGADRLDPERPDLKTEPELYNLDGVAYESLILGLFTIWTGQPTGRPKPNQVCAGFSRDGFNWFRPSHSPLLPVSEHQGDWNWGNVQSAGGGCLVVGDQLYFYCSGRAGVPGKSDSGMSTTGLAVLRRDGFASMDADAAGGELLTRPIRFSGRRLFVNTDASHGELRVEILDENKAPVQPYSALRCIPVRSDSTAHEVHWQDGGDLAKLAGRSVRLRFHLTRGRLYSFWMSPDRSGKSGGYVAAGGPGLLAPRA
jgi:hypothetical protein